MDRESDDQSGSEEESSVVSSDLDEIDWARTWDEREAIFERDLPRVRGNDPDVGHLCGYGNFGVIQNMTNEVWEGIGRDISNNAYLEHLEIIDGALNDDTLSSLFRGLSRSSSIIDLELYNNEFSAAGVRSLEPFMQNSINLRELHISHNNIEAEGFNILLQALCGSPIELLYCIECGITSIEIEKVPTDLRLLSIGGNNIKSEGFNRLLQSFSDGSVEILNFFNCQMNIESIEIDDDSIPRNLRSLSLLSNRIDANGCRRIAKLLEKGNSKLEKLILQKNLVDDEGVAILVDALKTNVSLKTLNIKGNDGISKKGRILILKMLNDMSSINSTLQSNHTLQTIDLGVKNGEIESCIFEAIRINRAYSTCLGAAGREKLILTQLHSKRRAELVEIQGVESQSLYGEINPLHLPEVLSLVGRRHGRKELYLALKASISDVISTVNRKLYLQRRRANHVAIVEEIDAELAEIESLRKGNTDDRNRNETRGNKRPRV